MVGRLPEPTDVRRTLRPEDLDKYLAIVDEEKLRAYFHQLLRVIRNSFEDIEDSIDNIDTGGGEANTGSNLGAGTGVFASKVGVDLQFRSLVEGSNVTFDVTSDTITINSTGGGGGSTSWGAITGTLSDQTDLQNALDLKADISSLATVATSGAYSDLSGVPTNLSDFTNDTGFITASSTDVLTNKSGNISQWTNDVGYLTSAPVTSVNSQTGVVVLDTDDISEGVTNLYYTEARVSANTDVAANTADRHSPVTVTDSAQIDFTLTGQDITASLTTAVNNSLALADSALQSGDNISELTNDSGFITGNETVTLSGDVTGSGSTAITTDIAANVIGVTELSATGTADVTTFLRGDNTWAVPSGGGGGPVGESFAATNNSNQSTTSTTFDTVTNWTEQHSDSSFSFNATTGILTVNHTGTIMIGGSVSLEQTSGNNRAQPRFRLIEGSTEIDGTRAEGYTRQTGAGDRQHLAGSRALEVTSGDTFAVQIGVNSATFAHQLIDGCNSFWCYILN